MRKGISFAMTMSVIALILIITAFTVIQGSGSILEGFYGFADSQVEDRAQNLGGDGESSGGSNGNAGNNGEDGSGPRTLSNTEICWSETEIVTCENLEITDGGRNCDEFETDSNGEVRITEAPGDEYVCRWDEDAQEADWVRR